MLAPLHKACGTRHFLTQPCPLGASSRREAAREAIKPATAKPVQQPKEQSAAITGQGITGRITRQPLPDAKKALPDKRERSDKSGNAARVARWKARHPEAARAIDAELKRKKRARLKSASQPVNRGPIDAELAGDGGR